MSLQHGGTAVHASRPGQRFPQASHSYKVEGREVFVLRVIYGARDLENLFAG